MHIGDAMRMRRALAVTIATLVSVPAFATAAPTEVSLTIAKSKRYVFAYGTVSPARPDRPVRVRLFRDGVLRATKWDRLSSQRRYGVRFVRPTSGNCEVKVRFRTGAGRFRRAAEAFGCAIPNFSTGTATITTGTSIVTVGVQIADEDHERGYGLMYRRRLGADKGMAFLFGGEVSGAFYMKNTLIPLSIAFWDGAGRIVSIMDMEPCEADPCPLYDPQTSYVGALEVNQGAFEAWGVAEGDLISVTED